MAGSIYWYVGMHAAKDRGEFWLLGFVVLEYRWHTFRVIPAKSTLQAGQQKV